METTVQVTHKCSGGANCINRQGSYICTCPEVIEELIESVKVGSRDQCARVTQECSGGANCINRQRSYSCTCPEGYKRVN